VKHPDVIGGWKPLEKAKSEIPASFRQKHFEIPAKYIIFVAEYK
jgi:hypothetical protein